MTDTVIQVEGLGKRYRIGAAQQRYVALRDVIARGARSFGRRLFGRRSERAGFEEFWALRDVSFAVNQGECIGIIGRNGAGKSTLLKLLSRITEPTEGRFRIRGRVASLLEVGTGFHPELTGRENVYLNGSILGMSRKEIDRKFDEIVAFAEVEKFLDTPVKHYSSGMYMRLAFAIAAHLEPEILVVDEVLAVGDAQFQQKCLGKMEEVARHGRTVLFVSHNIPAVQVLCSRALWLKAGRRAADGEVTEVVSYYLRDDRDSVRSPRAVARDIGGGVQVDQFEITPAVPTANDPIEIAFTLSAEAPVRLSHLCLIVYSALDVRVGVIDFRRQPPHEFAFRCKLSLKCRIDQALLIEGEYKVGLYGMTTQTVINVTDLARLKVGPLPAHEGFVPYPVQYRGLVEFSYRIDAVTAE